MKMQRVASQQNQQNVNPNVGGATSSEVVQSNVDVKANLDSVLEIGTDKRNSKNNRGGKRKKVTPLEPQSSAATSSNVQ